MVDEAHRLLAELARAHPLRRNPTLEWRRYRTTAGRAFYDRWAIALSESLIVDEDRLRDTLFHEYAHLMAFERHGMAGRGHGAAWKHAMRELGLEPEVKHRYPCRRNVPRRTVTYRCKRCGVAIVRRRRLPRKGRWVHAGCGGSIQLLAIEPANLGPELA